MKAVWIMATNPLVSLPDAQRARAALERAELVVVQDPHHPTETSALAHAVLPAAAWPEKEGTMTSSERRIGLVRRALAPPGEARADWEIVAGLARRLGFGDDFAWPDAAAVFDEFAACTAGRPCDLSGVSHARLRQEGGLQWPCPAVPAGEPHTGTRRLYTDHRFPTPDGRARFAPTPARASGRDARSRLPADADDRARRRPVAHDVAHRQVAGAARGGRHARARPATRSTPRPPVCRTARRHGSCRAAASFACRSPATTRCRAASRSRPSTGASSTRRRARAR